MAKYIIDIPDEHELDWVNKSSRLGFELCFPINETATNKQYYIPTGLKLESYTEPDRKDIENEVWEFARIVTSMNMQDYMECFVEDAALVMTYQEAKTKYDTWKKQKDEIHVGDEVRCMDRVGIVVRINSMDGGSNVVWEDGATAYIGVKDLTKTGRHFEEVKNLLEKMKEN